MRLAREAGYVINSTARNLRLKRTETVSVVIPLAHEASQPLTDPFFVEMLGYLADAITQRGYGVLLRKIVPPMNDWLPNLVASGRSDGVIVIGQSTEHQVLEEVSSYYWPLVVWGPRRRVKPIARSAQTIPVAQAVPLSTSSVWGVSALYFSETRACRKLVCAMRAIWRRSKTPVARWKPSTSFPRN
jgi:hypothetical protein